MRSIKYNKSDYCIILHLVAHKRSDYSKGKYIEVDAIFPLAARAKAYTCSSPSKKSGSVTLTDSPAPRVPNSTNLLR